MPYSTSAPVSFGNQQARKGIKTCNFSILGKDYYIPDFHRCLGISRPERALRRCGSISIQFPCPNHRLGISRPERALRPRLGQVWPRGGSGGSLGISRPERALRHNQNPRRGKNYQRSLGISRPERALRPTIFVAL